MPESAVPVNPASVSVETGLADVVTLQRRRQARMSADDEESFFLDMLSEYQWARDAAGLAPTTLDGLIKPVIEVCEYYGTVPWQLTPREVDKYFAGPGKRAPASGHSRHCAERSTRSTRTSSSSSNGTRVRSCAASEPPSSLRSTRSTGRATEGTSGYASRRPGLR
ncbi:hypothetical protein ACIQ9J_24245 [Streptomyces sp. NPDC094153]|uniref:hypothetical protein n=1 Tax=Streptomyces sp. NPDC094153 TaxID=3366058 RepID=UPI0038000411